MNQPHITMWSYLWDFVDDGMDDVLREMKDEIGLSALSVATHYHTVEHLRPHTKGAFIYRSDSALYFQPELARYAGTKIRHQVSPIAVAGNPLARLCDRAAKVGLDVVSWTLACHSSWLGSHYPDCSQRSALGDRYPEALCPANPDVRGFLTALAGDLTHNYGISLVELESCHYEPGRHFHHHEKVATPMTAADHFLHGLCFCEHCGAAGRAAGVDMASLERAVGKAMREGFASGEGTRSTIAEVIARTPGLRAFVDARVKVVSTLLESIRKASRSPISPISWSSAEESGLTTRGASEAAGAEGSVTICAYTSDADAARRAIRAAAAEAGGVGRLRVGYHTFPPVVPDRDSLMRVVEASLDEGVRAFSFYNYGIAPRRSLGWVKDAAARIRG